MTEPLLAQTSFLDEPPARTGEQLVPDGARVEQCASCGAAIIWCRTKKGRSMPLSAATIVWRGTQRFALSHFADCPDAQEWSTS